MVITGLEALLDKFPSALTGKRIGILCHAPSITSRFEHITDIFYQSGGLQAYSNLRTTARNSWTDPG